MSKISCLCGEIIRLRQIPEPKGFKLVWEPIIEGLMDDLLTIHQQAISTDEFEDRAYKSFYQRKPPLPQIYECPHCGRLAVFIDPSDSEPSFWFKQEIRNVEATSIHSLLENQEVRAE